MHGIWKSIVDCVSDRWQLMMYGWRTLCCTIYCSWDYTIDTAMEPAFWFVDNFAKVIGPVFVCLVVSLTMLFVFVAYLIGIPYWWHRSPSTLICLFLVGHWILANIVFNYYMALTTAPGLPPRGVLLPETASVCRKCISPKPPRTHHCSVCDTCILKMDHHCPWLNQCVGHFNHRFFLLYMMYMALGTLMVMLYGYDILWQEMFGKQLRHDGVIVEDDGDAGPLMVPVIDADTVSHLYNQTETSEWRWSEGVYRPGGKWRRSLILFESLISAGVFLALGGLSLWHGRLITRGETSIEAHINRKETARLAQMGQVYSNPYNMGAWRNWKLFLGLQRGRGWRHVILPSRHLPETDGLTWRHLALEDAHIKLL